jgi:cell division protein FtsX
MTSLPLSIAKTAAGIVTSLGAGAVVSNAIKASIPANSKTIQKISIGIGGFVLSSMVSEMATKYVNENIDSAVKQFQTAKDNIIVVTPTPSETPES